MEIRLSLSTFLSQEEFLSQPRANDKISAIPKAIEIQPTIFTYHSIVWPLKIRYIPGNKMGYQNSTK